MWKFENSLDKTINDFVAPATDFISDIVFFSISFSGIAVPLIIVWLLAAGIFFTCYMKFINFTAFRHAVDVVKGDYDDPNHIGEVSHFQALSAALSGTLGLGNIAGVAVAISLGGPGATLWMIVAGLIGMCSKFTECTLGVKYRDEHADGSISGGPMYYLSKNFKDKGMKHFGKFLAVFFSIMCVGGSLGGGNMFQSNQAASQFIHVFASDNDFIKNNAWLFGLLMALCVGIVIIGGIKSIASVSELIVPFMCGLYMLAGFIIIFIHFKEIPSAITSIFMGAFAPHAITGGVLGVMLQGFQRASFSNEAGIGSASIAHSAVRTKEPVSEGMVGLLEPFIDTVIVCTMTALVIVITNAYKLPDTNGIQLTSKAFESVIGWFPYVLVFAVFLFAYATMISWSYYGSKSWAYLFGPSKFADISFKIIFCTCTVIGASMNLDNIIKFSDAMIFAMSFPNIIGLYFMAPEVKRDLKIYLSKIKSGEIKKYK